MNTLFCRLWDGERMHYVPSSQERPAAFVGMWLEDSLVLSYPVNWLEKQACPPTHFWRLMWAIGHKDRRGLPLYDGDLVEWSDRVWEIGWSAERSGYALFRPGGTQRHYAFSISGLHARQLVIIGNRFEHPNLYQPDYYSDAA